MYKEYIIRKTALLTFTIVSFSVAAPSIDAAIIYSGPQDHILSHYSDESIPVFMAGVSESIMIGDEFARFVLEEEMGNIYFTHFDHPLFVRAFEKGFEIGPAEDWRSIVTSRNWLVQYEETDELQRGEFFAQANKFIAIRVADEDETYFGWVRMSHSMADEELIIHDWAWNSDPGQPILAGEIPEPASVALLTGSAALAVIGFRRRRRSAKS